MSTRARVLVALALVVGAVIVGWSVVGPPVVARKTIGRGGATVECRSFGVPGMWAESSTTYGAAAEPPGMARVAQEAGESCRREARTRSTIGVVLLAAGIAGTVARARRERRLPQRDFASKE